jgi:hypothetical protein
MLVVSLEAVRLVGCVTADGLLLSHDA